MRQYILKIMKTAFNRGSRTGEMIRKHFVFYGSVQGVGFRFRAQKAADLAGCTGWVRNDWNGTVTMELQGTEEQIDAVILAIERGRFVRIENMESRVIPVDEEERGFRTEYD